MFQILKYVPYFTHMQMIQNTKHVISSHKSISTTVSVHMNHLGILQTCRSRCSQSGVGSEMLRILQASR